MIYAHLDEEKGEKRIDTRHSNEGLEITRRNTFAEEWDRRFGAPPSLPSLPLLIPLPDHIFLLVAHYCDLRTQLSLAATCVRVRGLLHAPVATAASERRLRIATRAMRRAASVLSISFICAVVLFVCLGVGFFALVMFFANR